jgi:D-arginine dehydrogenase
VTLVIIGGGIAGLSTALYTARSNVVVLEREATPFGLSSARNAAIFRPLEEQSSLVELAKRSRILLTALGSRLLHPNGLCLVATRAESLETLIGSARVSGLAYEIWEHSELERRAPWLAGGRARLGLYLPDGGTVDLVALSRALLQGLAERGVVIRSDAKVEGIELKNGAVAGVRLASGELIEAERVVNAAGAWAGGIRRDFAPPLVSHRRHLVELDPGHDVDPNHPICWNVETEVYFRPHGKLILACPGDDTPHDAELPKVDAEVVLGVLPALRAEAPVLGAATVKRAWACLRTRCRDGLMATGADPTTPGLHWLAGLGGHGLTVGLGAGQLLASLLDGRSDPLAAGFAPSRFSR